MIELLYLRYCFGILSEMPKLKAVLQYMTDF